MLCPGMIVFLDVDDLNGGKGAEYVDRSLLFCLFVSAGYFDSPNCVRELLRAALTDKPILTLFETDHKQGGLSMAEAINGLHSALARLAKWGLIDELRQWGHEPPSFETLRAKVFEQPPLEWSTIPVYRDTSLRLLVEPALEPKCHGSFSVSTPLVSSTSPRPHRWSVMKAAHRDSQSPIGQWLSKASPKSQQLPYVPKVPSSREGASCTDEDVVASVSTPLSTVHRPASLISLQKPTAADDIAVCLGPTEAPAEPDAEKVQTVPRPQSLTDHGTSVGFGDVAVLVKASQRFKAKMTEDEAASIIAAIARGRKERLAFRDWMTSMQAARDATQAGARWGIARAKSRIAMPLMNMIRETSNNKEASPKPNPHGTDAAIIREAQRTYMASCPSRNLPILTLGSRFTHHIYCSQYNPGAIALAKELQAFLHILDLSSKLDDDVSAEYLGVKADQAATILQENELDLAATPTSAHPSSPFGSKFVLFQSSRRAQQPLKTTSDAKDLPTCEHMLLHLNANTWTRGKETSDKLAHDVISARKLGVHLLLVHEQPNIADEGGGQATPYHKPLGVPFDAFFNNPEGTTPKQLVIGGIYNEIAVPLKGGAYRPVAMALLAKAVASVPNTSGGPILADASSLDFIALTADDGTEEYPPMTPRSARIRHKLLEKSGWVGTKKTAMEEFGVPPNPVPQGLQFLPTIEGSTRPWSPRRRGDHIVTQWNSASMESSYAAYDVDVGTDGDGAAAGAATAAPPAVDAGLGWTRSIGGPDVMPSSPRAGTSQEPRRNGFDRGN